MKNKFLKVVAAMSVAALMLSGCGNKAEETIGEIEDVQEVADASTPKPTSTPVTTATPKPTQTPTPSPEDVEGQEDEADVSSEPENPDEIDWSKVLWTDLIPDDYWNSSYDDNTSSGGYAYTDNNSAANTTPGQNTTPNSGNSTTSGTNDMSPKTENSGSSSAPTNSGSTSGAAPQTTTQPAQHTHNYVWVESGNTRIRTCSCGATTGSAENKIADGVWGYWGDASELLTAVNNQRANGESYGTVDEWGNPNGWVTGLPALDNSLSASAESLAISSAQTNSYYGQGIHAGGSAQDAVSSWVGQGLMNRDTTSGGVACLAKSNGDGTYTVIWVLVVG